jgi:uncharacterized membrane protein
MVLKKNFNITYILYLVIFVLFVLLLIVSTLFYYVYNNIKKQDIIVVDKNVKIDSCPPCPKVDSSIPI